MRNLVLVFAMSALAAPAFGQTAEETEKAVDCLALTEVANDNRSVPDTAQIRQWRSIVETSPFCKQADQGVEYRVEEYRNALRAADETRRFALELMIESEAEKCVSGAMTTSYERGV